MRRISHLKASFILRRRAEVEIAAEHPELPVRTIKKAAKVLAEKTWRKHAAAGRVLVEKA